MNAKVVYAVVVATIFLLVTGVMLWVGHFDKGYTGAFSGYYAIAVFTSIVSVVGYVMGWEAIKE